MVAILVLLTLILFLTFDYFVVQRKVRQSRVLEGAVEGVVRDAPLPLPAGGTLGETLMPPSGFFLTRGHQWVRLLSGGILRMGADPLLVKALGSADSLDLPAPGTKLQRGDPMATLHRQGRALSLYTPVSGHIVAVNRDVAKHLSQIKTDPYRDGWMCELEPDSLNLSMLEKAFRDHDAIAWLRSEFQRLRDFLARVAEPEAVPVAVLQDGGLPVSGFGFLLNEQQWDKLVDDFFRPSDHADAGRTSAD